MALGRRFLCVSQSPEVGGKGARPLGPMRKFAQRYLSKEETFGTCSRERRAKGLDLLIIRSQQRKLCKVGGLLSQATILSWRGARAAEVVPLPLPFGAAHSEWVLALAFVLVMQALQSVFAEAVFEPLAARANR